MVCIYVLEELNFCEISAVEQIWCLVKVSDERILIDCIYYPDFSTENTEMLISLNRAYLLMTTGSYTGYRRF